MNEIKKITCIIQARTNSDRLPNKVLLKIVNLPIIIHIINRVKKSHYTKQIILATTNNSDDQVLLDIANDNEIISFNGNELDVLDRFYHAAKKYNADPIVRITGDCPLIDPVLIDEMIKFFLENDFDYISNTIERTFPDGLDVEIFTFSTLEKAFFEATWISEREHVTPYIIKNPKLFKLFSYTNVENLSHLRWCLDEASDYEMLQKIYQEFEPNNFFPTTDVLKLLEKKPEISKINSGIPTNEGYDNSIKNDKKSKS
ncbi:glycosyltransferase family protein [Nitrosopumilus sp.]|nr:glycosyltransferase family protein [Nitrosopumilus sp.]